jgi:dihydroorotase
VHRARWWARRAAPAALPPCKAARPSPAHACLSHTPAFPPAAQVPLLEQVPELRVVMEHITTKDAAEFVAAAPANVAASVTPQHMLLNRNALFVKGLRPHNYCLPILKRELHRCAPRALLRPARCAPVPDCS